MRHRAAILLLPLLMVLASASAGAAQGERSPADLRTEIDLLRQRIAQLEAQLTEAQRRAQALEAENLDLRKQLAERPADANDPDDPDAEPMELPIDQPLVIDPLPDDWTASPDSMYRAMAASYQEALAGEPRQTRAQQQRYFSVLSKWLREAERDFRADVRWAVRITRVLEQPTGDGEILLQVVDPDTGHAWGEPFTLTVKRPLRELLANNPSSHYWTLLGTVSAKPRLNRERETPGFFLNPLLIGPYAEFGYEMLVRDLKPLTLVPPAPGHEPPPKDSGGSSPSSSSRSSSGASSAANSAHSSANSHTVTDNR